MQTIDSPLEHPVSPTSVTPLSACEVFMTPQQGTSTLAVLYRDWLSVANGHISAHPSPETLRKYQRWAEELILGGPRQEEGAAFRHFCRVRLEGTARGLDLLAAREAFHNGQDFPPLPGWEASLGSVTGARHLPKPAKRVPEKQPALF